MRASVICGASCITCSNIFSAFSNFFRKHSKYQINSMHCNQDHFAGKIQHRHHAQPGSHQKIEVHYLPKRKLGLLRMEQLVHRNILKFSVQLFPIATRKFHATTAPDNLIQNIQQWHEFCSSRSGNPNVEEPSYATLSLWNWHNCL